MKVSKEFLTGFANIAIDNMYNGERGAWLYDDLLNAVENANNLSFMLDRELIHEDLSNDVLWKNVNFDESVRDLVLEQGKASLDVYDALDNWKNVNDNSPAVIANINLLIERWKKATTAAKAKIAA